MTTLLLTLFAPFIGFFALIALGYLVCRNYEPSFTPRRKYRDICGEDTEYVHVFRG